MNITVIMELEDKNCKSVYRYKETDDDKKPPILNYLYIKKYAFEGKPPKTLEINIKKGE